MTELNPSKYRHWISRVPQNAQYQQFPSENELTFHTNFTAT